MRIIERLDKYMEIKGINDNQITVNCGLSIGLLGKARQGKSDLGKKSIEKILTFYQDINRVWLLTGEGEMVQDDNQTRSISYEEEEDLKKKVQRLEQTIDILLDKIRALEEENNKLKDSLDTYKKVGA